MHRRIYRAVKAKDADLARHEMSEHLDLARQAQATEEREAKPARRTAR
jgi:DNA-binding FadR family transcriptional regulator